MFFKTSIQSCRLLKSVLNKFCLLSGLKINHSKSELFVSPNCNRQKKWWFSGILGVRYTDSPSKYLGMELGKMNCKRKFFQLLFDNIQQRLARWKAHNLSQGGRLTLIKSTLASVPVYFLSCFKASDYVCKKLDKIIRSFWWEHEVGERKLHRKNWNAICQAKELGGVGIRGMDKMNKALQGKQAWKIITKPDSLMVATFLPKYCKNESFVRINPKPGDSWLWKSLLAERDVCLKGLDTQIWSGIQTNI